MAGSINQKPSTTFFLLGALKICVCHWHKWADLCSQRFSSSLLVLFELFSFFKLNISHKCPLSNCFPNSKTCTILWASIFLSRWVWESIKSVALSGSIKRKLRAEVWLLHQSQVQHHCALRRHTAVWARQEVRWSSCSPWMSRKDNHNYEQYEKDSTYFHSRSF